MVLQHLKQQPAVNLSAYSTGHENRHTCTLVQKPQPRYSSAICLNCERNEVPVHVKAFKCEDYLDKHSALQVRWMVEREPPFLAS